MVARKVRMERTTPLESGSSLVKIMDRQMITLVKSKTPNKIDETR